MLAYVKSENTTDMKAQFNIYIIYFWFFEQGINFYDFQEVQFI